MPWPQARRDSSQKTTGELEIRSRGPFTGFSLLPQIPLAPIPSVLSPSPEWGLQKARYSELCHVNASATMRVHVVCCKGLGSVCVLGRGIEYTGLTQTRSERPRQVLGTEQLGGAEQLLAKAPTSCLCAGSREYIWKMCGDIQSPAQLPIH